MTLVPRNVLAELADWYCRLALLVLLQAGGLVVRLSFANGFEVAMLDKPAVAPVVCQECWANA
jgi:hypothetical protein